MIGDSLDIPGVESANQNNLDGDTLNNDQNNLDGDTGNFEPSGDDIEIVPEQPPETKLPLIAEPEQETAHDDTLGTDQTLRHLSKVRQP